VLRLEGRRTILAGFVPCLLNDVGEVSVECDYDERLLNSTSAAISRLACFLWTA
jgi:hypothetical protein